MRRLWCALRRHPLTLVRQDLLDEPWRMTFVWSCPCGRDEVFTRPAEMREVYEWELKRRGLQR